MNKLKVVCIIPSLYPGGAEKMALDLVTHLDKEMFEVTLISLYNCENSIYAELAKKRNISVLYLDKRLGFDFGTFKKLLEILLEIKPNIIHSHLQSCVYVIPYIYFNKNVKWIHTIHNEASKELPNLHSIIMKHYYKKGRAIPIAISEIIRKTICNTYGLSMEKVPLIYNGIDTQFFTPPQSKNSGTVVFCCVARFSSQKNHKLLLEAFYKAYRKCSNISLLLVGDGELRSEIEKQIDSYGIAEHVTLVGNTSNVLGWLQKSDVFVLSSDYEGLPLSILEAIAVGLPIIATKVGGIPDIVTDGEEGLIVPSGNAELFADAMVQMALNSKLRLQMKPKALNKAKKYDVRKMASLYGEIYQKFYEKTINTPSI